MDFRLVEIFAVLLKNEFPKGLLYFENACATSTQNYDAGTTNLVI